MKTRGQRRRAPRFFTRAGWLTIYAMACGYQHVTKIPHPDYSFGHYRIVFSLLNIETGTYEVSVDTQRYVLECIHEARRLYRQKVKEANGLRVSRRPSTKSERESGAPAYVYG